MDKRAREHWVPTVAAAAVAVAALGSVVMAKRGDGGAPDLRETEQSAQLAATDAAAPAEPAASSQRPDDDSPTSPAGQAAPVVKAPPLKRPPKPPATSFAERGASPAEPDAAKAMGGQAACGNCGTVETVVAVLDGGKPSGYQMYIRMDDGTQRTVEQRGALAAGSRVQIQGKFVKALVQGG